MEVLEIRELREIDLLIIRDNIFYPLECKKTASPNKSDIRHFSALENLGISMGSGGVICLSPQALPLSRNVWSIPVGTV